MTFNLPVVIADISMNTTHVICNQGVGTVLDAARQRKPTFSWCEIVIRKSHNSGDWKPTHFLHGEDGVAFESRQVEHGRRLLWLDSADTHQRRDFTGRRRAYRPQVLILSNIILSEFWL